MRIAAKVVREGWQTIAVGEVAALDHEVLDDSVERRPLKAKALFAGGQGSEVLGGFGHSLAVESHHDAAH